MKVLWVVNVLMPIAAKILNVKLDNFSGGWLTGSFNAIKGYENITFGVAFPYKSVVDCVDEEGTYFYSFEKGGSNKKLKSRAKAIVDSFSPDIIHIYGTEFIHSSTFQMIASLYGIPTVVSIQGLVSEYEKHFYSDLPYRAVHGVTLRNIIFRDNVYQLRRSLRAKGKYEIACIRETKNVIGRTVWDKACTKMINNQVNYYHNDETLRDTFYNVEWKQAESIPNSIFISQCSSPIKGFHFIIGALPIVLQSIPDVKVFVVGKNIMDDSNLKERLNKTYYMRYCKRLIKKSGLESHFTFLGRLTEEEMAMAMKKANIFVLPSTIENSPNSLCEAMLLGLPCIASYVGGVPTLVEGESVITYQFNSIPVLAKQIVDLLQNKDKQIQLSKKARKYAIERHNKKRNADALISIYKDILAVR